MSKDDEELIPSPGKIRPSQLVTSYGPGSLLQTNFDSVLIMGIDFWFNKNKYVKKNHTYLQQITKRNHFREPKKENPNNRNIACISFPRWGFCKVCRKLQRHNSKSGKNGKHMCTIHSQNGELLPARLVVTCERGHLDEFPWVQWAHSNREKPVPICQNPDLKWVGGANNSSISSYVVECKFCGAKNSLRGATDRRKGIELYNSDSGKFFQYQCTGQIPWLHQEEKCVYEDDAGKSHPEKTEIAFGILSRATSMYYPKKITGIIIPELAHPIVKYLETDTGKEKIKSYSESLDLTGINLLKKIAELLLKNVDEFKINSYTVDEIFYFLNKMDERSTTSKINSEMELRKIEYDDLKRNVSEYKLDRKENDPDIVINDVELNSSNSAIFESIRQISTLTAIEVLRYFTRLNPPKKNNICEIQITSGTTKNNDHIKPKNWLPCVIKKGEGLFMVFRKDFLNKYLNHPEIKKRLAAMLANHKEWEKFSNWVPDIQIDEQFILLHSISHIIIKELAFNSGYGEASLSERIYSSEEMHGLLIYTTSTGDGSMGGLVKQKDLKKIILGGLLNKEVCSRDPICINTDPNTLHEVKLPIYLRQNGSACFGCMMVPETSCEYFNRMLDRKILVDKKIGILQDLK